MDEDLGGAVTCFDMLASCAGGLVGGGVGNARVIPFPTPSNFRRFEGPESACLSGELDVRSKISGDGGVRGRGGALCFLDGCSTLVDARLVRCARVGFLAAYFCTSAASLNGPTSFAFPFPFTTAKDVSPGPVSTAFRFRFPAARAGLFSFCLLDVVPREPRGITSKKLVKGSSV